MESQIENLATELSQMVVEPNETIQIEIPQEIFPSEIFEKIYQWCHPLSKKKIRLVSSTHQSIVEDFSGLSVQLTETEGNLEFVKRVKVTALKLQNLKTPGLAEKLVLKYPNDLKEIFIDGPTAQDWIPKIQTFANLTILKFNDLCLNRPLFLPRTIGGEGDIIYLIFPRVKKIVFLLSQQSYILRNVILNPTVEANLSNFFKSFGSPNLLSLEFDIRVFPGQWSRIFLKEFLLRHQRSLKTLKIENSIPLVDVSKDKNLLPPNTSTGWTTGNLENLKLSLCSPRFPDTFRQCNGPSFWTSFLENQSKLKEVELTFVRTERALEIVLNLGKTNPQLEKMRICIEFKPNHEATVRNFDLSAFANCKNLKHLDFLFDDLSGSVQIEPKNMYKLPPSLVYFNIFGYFGNSEFEKVLDQMKITPWVHITTMKFCVLVPLSEEGILVDMCYKLRDLPTLTEFFFSQSQVRQVGSQRFLKKTGPTIHKINGRYHECHKEEWKSGVEIPMSNNSFY